MGQVCLAMVFQDIDSAERPFMCQRLVGPHHDEDNVSLSMVSLWTFSCSLASMNCKHIYIYVYTLISYIYCGYIYTVYIYYTHCINHRLTQILDASVDQKSRHD